MKHKSSKQKKHRSKRCSRFTDIGVILFAADILLDLAAGKNVFIEAADKIICILSLQKEKRKVNIPATLFFGRGGKNAGWN